MTRHPLLVSACLAGIPCRYDGRAKTDPALVALVDSGAAIARCAEVAGGLPTPRPPSEIIGGDGRDVLDGRARVVTGEGEDVSAAFICGARAVADEAERAGVREAVLQARSPSCGCGAIYDGTYSGTVIAGNGVLAAELLARGIRVRPHDAPASH